MPRDRAHDWLNTAFIGLVLALLASEAMAPTLFGLTVTGCGFLIALVSLFEVVQHATDEGPDETPEASAEGS